MADWQDDDEDFLESEETEETTEEEEKPDDLDARVQTAVQAAVEAERTRIREELQQEFDQHKVRHGHRYDQTIRSLRAGGFDVDRDGNVFRVGNDTEKPKPQSDEEEILIDPLDDPAAITAKIRKLSQQEAKRLAAEENKSIREELAALRKQQANSSIALSAPTQRAEAIINETAPWAKEDPIFQRHFQASLQQIPFATLENDEEVQEAVEMAAGVSIAHARAEYRRLGKSLPQVKTETPKETPKETPQDEAARRAAANRASLQQTRSTNGPTPPEPASDAEKELLASFPASWGITNVHQLRALEKDPTGEAFRKLNERAEARRQQRSRA